jgi:hypothetical protein
LEIASALKTKADAGATQVTYDLQTEHHTLRQTVRDNLDDIGAIKLKIDTTYERLDSHVKHMSNALDEMNREVGLKANVKDILSLLDAKAGRDELTRLADGKVDVAAF